MHTTSDLSIYILITRPDSNPDVYIRFYSLNGFKKDTAKPHPAAAFPFIRLHTVGSGEPTGVYAIQIFGQYVIVESWVQMEAICSYTIDVYNWKTGQLVSVRVSASLRMNVAELIPGHSASLDIANGCREGPSIHRTARRAIPTPLSV